jgi:hypothetical protein
MVELRKRKREGKGNDKEKTREKEERNNSDLGDLFLGLVLFSQTPFVYSFILFVRNRLVFSVVLMAN